MCNFVSLYRYIFLNICTLFYFHSWAFYPGGIIENYSGSNGNSLHFDARLLQHNTLTTLDLYISSDTFVQFDLIISNTSRLFYIDLQYTTDSGIIWHLLENDCQNDCENRGL